MTFSLGWAVFFSGCCRICNPDISELLRLHITQIEVKTEPLINMCFQPGAQVTEINKLIQHQSTMGVNDAILAHSTVHKGENVKCHEYAYSKSGNK